MRGKIIERFLLWVACWARLVDGLVGVITLTVIDPDLSLRAEQWYLDYPRPISAQEPSADEEQAKARKEYGL